ncbi:MAG: hypothetical protein KGL39_40960 [Patescibacteria group bacterium]|nr:hypothetical protein [Patescibacteria group bacterium]
MNINEKIVFQNSGEIDVRTISTFGCSVKETKNPIGYFGTGMKYAIAVLLRTGHQVTIYSGRAKYEFGVKQDSIRGKDFNFVEMNGKQIGFTTELGKNWEVWMACRELYCNSMDEDQSEIFQSNNPISGEVGFTKVCVTGAGIVKAHGTREQFILQSESDFMLGTIAVSCRPSTGFFYNGIKVFDLNKPSLFTYNETGFLELTEDRTAKDQYSIAYKISREALEHGDRDFFLRALTAPKDNYESQFDYHGWSSTEPSPHFFPAVSELQRDRLSELNLTALRLWREKGGGHITPRRIQPTKVQSSMLERAISFCEKIGFKVRDEYPIIIVETLGEHLLALADEHGKQILMSESIFRSAGTKGVASALIEEYLHLKFKYKDCTRELQTFLFDKVVSLGEELQGEPI